MSIAIALHLLSTMVWVGGMFFAYVALRPAAALTLDPPLRLSLWVQVFQRFFPWVWLSIALLLATGFWMIFAVFGGMASTGIHVHSMMTIAFIMIALFVYLNLGPYKILKVSVSAKNWSEAANRLAKIRQIVGINLSLGLINIIIAATGRLIS